MLMDWMSCSAQQCRLHRGCFLSFFCFQAEKKKSAASPSPRRHVQPPATRAAPSVPPQDAPPTLAPPPVAASSVGTAVAPPPSALTNRHSSTSDQAAGDHTYGLTSGSAHNQPSKARRQKRAEEEEDEQQHHVTSSQEGGSLGTVGGASAVVLDGRQVRKPTQRVRDLQEDLQAKVSSNSQCSSLTPPPLTPPLTGPDACVVLQAEAKEKRTPPPSSSFSSSPLKKRPCQSAVIQNPGPGPGIFLGPGQVMLVMSPMGSVQLTVAPSQRLQPKNIFGGQLATPLLGGAHPANQPVAFTLPPAIPPTFMSRPLPSGVATPPRSSLPPSQIFLPYKATVKTDPSAPPPLRREALQFDPALIFLESREAVCDWLSGQGGVRLPGAGVSLPYLPPFASSLSALSALLCAQKSLSRLSLQLLPPRHTATTANQHAERPDSTANPTQGS